MLPIRDTIRSRSFPLVNWGLIIGNGLIFLFEASLPAPAFERFIQAYGLIPARFDPMQPLGWLRVFTSMFLHGGWFHLISNMWTLYIFGDNVEDRMGSGRYLVFYLLAGAGAGVTHAFTAITFDAGPDVPTVGASGAIAGVLGAYFLLFPKSRVITLVPWFFLFTFVEIPAVIYLFLWFGLQLFSALVSLGAVGSFSGIAWWAHIGGFVLGMLLVGLFARRPRAYTRWYRDEYWPW
jgi:membrane associated rhomboid family serine protease